MAPDITMAGAIVVSCLEVGLIERRMGVLENEEKLEVIMEKLHLRLIALQAETVISSLREVSIGTPASPLLCSFCMDS